MSDKYQNKYRIPSARLQTWDYASSGAYFITICTAKRQHYFGEIINGKMELSVQVEMAHRYWLEIPRHFSFVMLDEFVVMPNHVHGIIIVDNRENFSGDDRIAAASVETGHTLSLHPRFRNQGKNTISTMVGSYKSAVTKCCNENKLPFGWQSRFHDHIIRDNDEFHRIKNYIVRNPENWEQYNFFQQELPFLAIVAGLRHFSKKLIDTIRDQ